MKFAELPVAGAYAIDHDQVVDERGSFTRTFCRDEFEAHGLSGEFVQCAMSTNTRRGTLRGLHFQRAPFEETKLVRCLMGSLYDVVVDLRPASPTHRRWAGTVLTAACSRSIYVPKGCAHGYLTLVDNTEVMYQISPAYRPTQAAGVRWDDPAFAIQWPAPIELIAARDRCFPDYKT